MVQPAGGAQPGLEDFEQPVRFGKYVLLDRISIGGMAEVFKAKLSGAAGFEKIIAVKRILPALLKDKEFIEMFVDEAKIAGQLTQENICPIFELGKVGESYYIAMEHIWGKDLLQIINRFRRMRRYMPPVMAAWIASKLCEALDYAHRKTDTNGNPLNIIHRDISPQNVIVGYEGQVKLIDFGIAKAASRTTRTRAGVLKGKFGYMSPEQVKGHELDPRSDIFTVGTCLWEMTVGARLFLGESDFSTLEKVRRSKVSKPSDRVSNLPEEYENIIMRALERDPNKRFQSAAEMLEALQAFLIKQRPPFGTSTLSNWMKTAFAQEVKNEHEKLEKLIRVEPLKQSQGLRPASQLAEAVAQSPEVALPKAGSGRVSTPGTVKLDSSEIEVGEIDAVSIATESTLLRDETASEDLPEIASQPTFVFFSAEDDVQGSAGQSSSGLKIKEQRQSEEENRVARGLGHAREVAGVTSENASWAEQPLGSRMPEPSASWKIPTLDPQAQRPSFLPASPSSRSSASSGFVWFLLGALAFVGLAGGVWWFTHSRFGSLHLDTRPEVTAEVLVDGIARGNSPLKIEEQEAGAHDIKLLAPGFKPAERRVEIVPSKATTLTVVLLREKPRAVAVKQEEQDIRKAPVAPEEDTVRSEDDEISPSSEEEQLNEMDTTDDSESELVPAKGTGIVTVRSSRRSNIFVDGKDTGKETPQRKLELTPGLHTIGLKTSDGVMHNYKVTVREGKRLILHKQP
ncbi:MAG: serine/threonine protein kinase [Myxococcales bacterium]|nr:MAG: serine/threonine protein kinase [Myxococcales bacterium]